MQRNHYIAHILIFLALTATLLASGCGQATASPTVTPTLQKTAAPTATPDLPVISAALPDRAELPNYE